MGIFDKFKKSANHITLEQLKEEEYKQNYFEECKYIWKNYVPESGQAKALQGELLRELEKLRLEAQDNGNVNWDEDFSFFCDFIKDTLCAQEIYSEEEKMKIKLIMSYFQECGDYAVKLYNEEISDDEFDIEKIAYTEDNLYDIVADAIGKLQAQNTLPIPFEGYSHIRR